MAKGVNRVQLLGNLGADPEARSTSSGTIVANLRLATNESYKSADGELVERTEWHNLVLWERLAEIAGEYLAKGDRIYVDGKLQTRSWEDRDGNKRYTTEIVVRDLVMLGGNNEGGGEGKREVSGDHEDQDDDLPF